MAIPYVFDLEVTAKENVRFFAEEELVRAENYISALQATNTKEFNKMLAVKKGDFSDFANLDPVVKGYLTSTFEEDTPEFREIFRDNSRNPEEKAQALKDAGFHLNPLARKVLATHNNANPESGSYAISEHLDRLVFKDTLMPATQEQKDKVRELYANREIHNRSLEEFRSLRFDNQVLKLAFDPNNLAQTAEQALQRNEEQQKMLLKSLVVMQAGDFQLRTGDKANPTKNEFSENMTHAFSHGGRVAFILPQTQEYSKRNNAFEAIMGNEEKRKTAGTFSRLNATHGVERPKSNSSVSSTEGFVERSGKKESVRSVGRIVMKVIGKALPGSSQIKRGLEKHGPSKGRRLDAPYRIYKQRYAHFGTDLAIGGIGKEGIAGKGGNKQTILNDGRSGHMYMGYVPGEKDKKPVMLMGLESDSPYRKNQTGHMHDIKATAEEASSTGGYKTDLKGMKYGGRVVDISGISSSQIKRLTDSVDEAFNSNDRARIEKLVDGLSGKKMTPEALAETLANGDPQKTAEFKSVINLARNPEKGLSREKISAKDLVQTRPEPRTANEPRARQTVVIGKHRSGRQM